jgi:uncharacterized membrane protein
VLLPVIIIVVVAIPILIIAFRATQRTKQAGEHPVPESNAQRQEIENEFAAAEAYQEQWREEEKKHPRDSIL